MCVFADVLAHVSFGVLFLFGWLSWLTGWLTFQLNWDVKIALDSFPHCKMLGCVCVCVCNHFIGMITFRNRFADRYFGTQRFRTRVFNFPHFALFFLQHSFWSIKFHASTRRVWCNFITQLDRSWLITFDIYCVHGCAGVFSCSAVNIHCRLCVCVRRKNT